MSTLRYSSPDGDVDIALLTDDQMIELWERSRDDGVFHIKEVQGVDTMETFQEALIRAVEKYERVAVRSCHDMGKTWTMSKLVLWYLSTHPGAKIVTTAPTARQVKLLLWSEIRAGFEKSKYPLGGEMGVQEWKIAADWWAVGFTTQKQASSGAAGEGQKNSGFQGIHAPYVLVIFDEATGIPPDIWNQLEGLMTSANVKFVAIGNPTTRACEFYNCFSDSAYKKLHFSCFDSPNLQANGIVDMASLEGEYNHLRELDEDARLERLQSYKVVRPHLLTCRWVMSRALKWGLDHALFISKVLGDFPLDDERCLISLGACEAAQHRKAASGKPEQILFGVDPARFGSDRTVITLMHDLTLKKWKTVTKRRTTEVSGQIIAMVNELSQAEKDKVTITVDGTGIGAGVVDELNEYQSENLEWRHVTVIEVHFGEKFKVDRDGSEAEVEEKAQRFANKKAEMFFYLAEDMKGALVLPEKADVFLEELPTIIYKFDSKGRWLIEDKESYKKRTGRPSPDHADSLALCNYGRYHTGGTAPFTAEHAKPTGRTLAGRLGDQD